MDTNQYMVARYLYDPFGRLLGQWGKLAEANVYRFSSKEWDANTRLYYYLYRFYEPDLQRWLNHDPIEEDGGVNLYQFVGNNPANLVDPLGLSSVAAPNKFDPCNDPCSDLLESIKQQARHVRGRYNDMLMDKGGLYGSRYSGKSSWLGHKQQFNGQQKYLRDAIKEYSDRGCGQKMPLPTFVYEEAARVAPTKPIRYELSAFDQWLSRTPVSDKVLEDMEKGAWVTFGVGATGATLGLAGPYFAGGAIAVGGRAAAMAH
jgi:RHS repeat-associated protein